MFINCSIWEYVMFMGGSVIICIEGVTVTYTGSEL